jgi:hypothetical protein
MASQFGFCNNCGAPRGTGAAGFCASCGTALPAAASAPAAVPPPPPPPTQAWGAAPPPPPPPQQPWNATPQQGWVAPSPQPWSGAPSAQKKRLSPVVIVGAIILIAALAVGGFFVLNGNKGGKATGSGSPTAAATAKPGTTAAAGTAGSGSDSLGDASGAFQNISSFQFKMTLAGGTYGDMLSMFGGSGETGSVPFTMSGTIVLKPQKAADINMGTFHIIEVDGYDYVDMGLGSYVKQAVTGSTSMADSFSPETMFSSMLDASSTSDYKSVGTGDRNGVQAVHYQATSAALKGLGSSLGVSGATWSSDVWIAVDGGYPVSFSVIGTAADKSVAYQVSFDITNVNDSGNKITAPTNVMGG